MMRGVDDRGCVFVGFTKDQLEKMLRGERVCSNPTREAAGPHLCFFAAESDAALLELLDRAYPETESMAFSDYRGQAEFMRHPKK